MAVRSVAYGESLHCWYSRGGRASRARFGPKHGICRRFGPQVREPSHTSQARTTFVPLFFRERAFFLFFVSFFFCLPWFSVRKDLAQTFRLEDHHLPKPRARTVRLSADVVRRSALRARSFPTALPSARQGKRKRGGFRKGNCNVAAFLLKNGSEAPSESSGKPRLERN